MKWQPIESAPVDEQWILVFGWHNYEPHVSAAFWADDDWFDSESASRSITAFGFYPTHWMPLPEPPTAP